MLLVAGSIMARRKDRMSENETTEEDTSWFRTGDEAADDVEKEMAGRQEAGDGKLFRFWMPPGDQHITFVDDDTQKHPAGFGYPFLVTEHQLQIGGDWKNWFTCVKGMKGPDGKPMRCPLCDSGDKPSHVAAYTVIDHNEWTSKKDGKVHKDEVKLYVVKSKVLKTIRKMSRKKEGLRGLYCELGRGSSDDPNSGNDFDVEKRVKLDDKIVAPDYRLIFKPKSRGDLLALVGDVKADAPQQTVKF